MDQGERDSNLSRLIGTSSVHSYRLKGPHPYLVPGPLSWSWWVLLTPLEVFSQFASEKLYSIP